MIKKNNKFSSVNEFLVLTLHGESLCAIFLGDLGIVYLTSVSANYNCRMLRRKVNWIFRIASYILGAIGFISIPSDLKGMDGAPRRD